VENGRAENLRDREGEPTPGAARAAAFRTARNVASPSEYLFTVVPDGTGRVKVRIPGAPGGEVALEVPIDSDVPRVTLRPAPGVSEPVVGTTFDIAVTFSEEVTGFTLADLDVTNGTAGSLDGGGASYGATITPTGAGVVTIDVAENAATDGDGNGNFEARTLRVDAQPVDAETAALVSEFLLGRADALARSQPRLTRFLDGPVRDQGLTLSFGADGDGDRAGRIDGAFVRDRLWGEITGSWSEGTTDTATTDSHYILGTLGAHWRMGDTWRVGAMLQLDTIAEDASHDTLGTVRIEGRGWLVGPYAVGRPWDAPLTVEARLLAGRSGNDLTYADASGDRMTGTFATDRWLAQLRVEGDIPLAWGTLTPYADGTWTRDAAAPFTAGSARVDVQSITLGQLELGADVAVPLTVDTGTLTLTAGVGLILSHRDAGAGDEDRVPSARGTLDVGLDYRLDNDLSATVKATHDGLGAGDHDRTGLTLGLDWRF